MASFNRVIIAGNLVRDVDLRFTPGGTAVTDNSLAINRKWFDKNTQQQNEETTFVDFTLWGKTAEVAAQYLSKGSQLLIEGRLQQEQWQDKQTGQNRNKLKVVGESMQMLGPKPSGQQQQAQGQQPAQNQMPASPVDSFYDAPLSEDVPF